MQIIWGCAKENNSPYLLAFNFHFINLLDGKLEPRCPLESRGKTFALRYSLLIIEIIFLAAFVKLCHICLLRPSLKVFPWHDICLQGTYTYISNVAVGKSGLPPPALIYCSIK